MAISHIDHSKNGRQMNATATPVFLNCVFCAILNIIICLFASSAPGFSAPTEKDSLALAWESSPRTLDPRYAVDANSQYLEDLLHCSLMGFDSDGKLIHQLAKETKWKDNKTLEVIIKDHILFANGTAVSVKDVAATYGFFIDPSLGTKSPRSGAFKSVEKIDILTPNTLIFHLSEPDASFLTNLVVGILPEKTARQKSAELNGFAGCGPFTLTTMTPGEIKLEQNPRYSIGTPPRLKKILIKVVKDETTRFAKLQNRELDLVQNLISRDKLKAIAKFPGIKILRKSGLNTTYLGFNMKDPVLKNVLVRRALAQAIDRKTIIDYVLQGYAIEAQTMLPPTDSFYNKDLKPVTYAPDVAKKLLDDAGYRDPDGEGNQSRFDLTLSTTTDITRITVAKAIAAQLRKIGINAKVAPMEWSRFKTSIESGAIQMWTLSWIGFKDPDIYRYAFSSANIPPNGGNRGFYSNPAIDKQLDAARQEINIDARRNAYAKIQEELQKEAPYVFLWHEEVFAAVRDNIEGFEVYADGRLSSLQRAHRK